MSKTPFAQVRALGIAVGLLGVLVPSSGFAIEKSAAAPPLAPSASPPPPAAPVPTSRTRTTSAQSAALPPDPGPQAETQTAAMPREVDTRFAAAALLGFATDHLNLGLGVRFGKTLDNRIYVGGAFVYHVGESQTVSTPLGTSAASFSAFYLGPEGGYDFDVGPVIIRPYVGLGIASCTASGSGPGASVSASDTKFVLWPGGTVIYSVPDSPWFLGGDLRLVTIPGGPALGIVAFGGMHFGS